MGVAYKRPWIPPSTRRDLLRNLLGPHITGSPRCNALLGTSRRALGGGTARSERWFQTCKFYDAVENERHFKWAVFVRIWRSLARRSWVGITSCRATPAFWMWIILPAYLLSPDSKQTISQHRAHAPE